MNRDSSVSGLVDREPLANTELLNKEREPLEKKAPFVNREPLSSKEPSANREPSANKEPVTNQIHPLDQEPTIETSTPNVGFTPNKIEPSITNEELTVEPINVQEVGTPFLGVAEKSPIEPSITPQEPVTQDRVEPSFSDNTPSIHPRTIQSHSVNENHPQQQQPDESIVNNSQPLRNESTTDERQVPPADDLLTTPVSPTAPSITPRALETSAESRVEPSFNSNPNPQTQSFTPQPTPPAPPTPTSQPSQPVLQDPIGVTAHSDDSNEVEIQVKAASASSWAGMLERLNLNGLIKELAMNMACDDITADPMVFNLSPTWSFLHNQPREDSIIKEIHKVRGDNCGVKVILEDTVSETPAERLARLKEERMQQTKTDLSDDKGVQDLMNTFELSMNNSTIKPTNKPD